MSYVSREQLDRAKQVDLRTYLQQCEPQELVKLSPNMYSTRTHDSLKISNGLWHQWSSGIGGRSALDYLIKIRGMSLPDAVLRINSGTVSQPSFSYTRKSARKQIMRQGFILPERFENNKIVVAYLTQRGIDRSIVLDLIAQGRIYEERAHHNAVFVGIDRDGMPRHAAMRATGSKRFMIDVSGSDKRYSFSLEGSSDSRQLHVFESAIDLLSFCTLEKMSGNDWRQNHVLSLSGVSNDERSGVPEPLRKYLEDHPMVTEVYLHLDNDRAGRIATKAMEALGYELKHGKYLAIRYKDSERFRRVYKLGEEYSEEAIFRRIWDNMHRAAPYKESYNYLGTMSFRGTFKKYPRLSGLRALYYHYLYKMCILPQHKQSGRRPSPLLREDIIKLDKLIVQNGFLHKYKIDTASQLNDHRTASKNELALPGTARMRLRGKLKHPLPNETAERYRSEVTELTARMREVRREIKLCDAIEERSDLMREKLKVITEAERQNISRQTRKSRPRNAR